MNLNKGIEKQIKPFNFMLIGSEKNNVIPCLPFDKDTRGIEYRKFIDYKSDTTSDKLPLPTTAHWNTLEDVLTQYVRHNDHKFDYIDNIAVRKHIIADRIRYIGKESNNLDEAEIIGLDEEDYLEYTKEHEIIKSKEFPYWVISLKPKAVKDMGISKMALWKVKDKIKQGKQLSPKTKIAKILLQLYKETILKDED